jgi:hypothetical protein
MIVGVPSEGGVPKSPTRSTVKNAAKTVRRCIFLLEFFISVILLELSSCN